MGIRLLTSSHETKIDNRKHLEANYFVRNHPLLLNRDKHTSETKMVQSSRPMILTSPIRAYNRIVTTRMDIAVSTAVTTKARCPRDAPASSRGSKRPCPSPASISISEELTTKGVYSGLRQGIRIYGDSRYVTGRYERMEEEREKERRCF